jgi:regulator of replication initiation timing
MITGDIKNVKNQHEELQERIEEMKKKHLATVKEKALLKLEKDKLQRKVHDIDEQIKDREQKI